MEDETDKPIFAGGAMSLTLTQQDMANAVEYWLNGRIMKVPVQVTRMEKGKPHDIYTSATFAVLVIEKVENEMSFIEEVVS